MKYGGRSKWMFLSGLVVLAATYTLGLWVLAAHGGDSSSATLGLWNLGSRLFLVYWIRADRRIRAFSVPYEFDAFVFWGWPIAVFYYFYKTRRWKGILLALGIWCLTGLPDAVWSIVRIAATTR